MTRSKEVEQALVWAQRQGYYKGREVCAAYAEQHGLGIGVYDLGGYGEEVEFFDTPDAAAKAQEPTPGKWNPHKPLAG